MTSTKPDEPGKPLIKLDKQALKLFRPYRKTPLVKVIDAVAKAADQPELRVLCAGMLAVGIARGNSRMVRAGARMLLAHETANFAKNLIKHRIDRRRPRSQQGPKAAKPRKGRDRAKEMTSFPSGHSTGAMAVACAYAAQYPERRVPVLAAAGAIAASRVVAAAHYPSDVAAGATLGATTNAALGVLGRAIRAVALSALR